MIYLDNSATTRQYDEVTDFIYKVSKENFGNPSSLHDLGFESAKLIKDARRNILENLPSGGELIFTGSGTEADNMALHGVCRKLSKRGNKIITTSIEHPAILETCKVLSEEGFKVEYLQVDKFGCINIDDLKNSLDKDTIMVSIMTVNNEVGAIQPVSEALKVVKEFSKGLNHDIIFHTDAVQAYGKIPMNEDSFDLISASAHKIHGPKGIGFLYMKNGLMLPSYITGGGQENGYRSGTENVPQIAGFGKAALMTCNDLEGKMKKIQEVNDYLRDGLLDSLSDIMVNGPFDIGFTTKDGGKRCPSVLNISFMGTRGEVLLHTLEQDKIYVSTGSACSSHKTGDSKVLKAMGMSHKEIEGAIRFSFSEFNTKEDMDFVLDKTIAAVNRFRKLGSFR